MHAERSASGDGRHGLITGTQERPSRRGKANPNLSLSAAATFASDLVDFRDLHVAGGGCWV